MPPPTRSRCPRRRRRRPQCSAGETIPCSCRKHARSMTPTRRSLSLHPVRAPEKFLQVSQKPRDERADRKKETITMLERRRHSRQRRSAGRPAPPWQSTPYFDESRRSRKKLSIPGADMKSFHRLLLGQVGQKRRVCFRDIDERKRTSMIYAAIMGNLCPTQRTGAVKIYGRLQYFSLHAHLLETGPSIHQHGSLADVGPIFDLSNEEIGDIGARDDPVAPFRSRFDNFVESRPRAASQYAGPHDRPIE